MSNFRNLFIILAVLSAAPLAIAQERGKQAKPIKDAVSCNEFAAPVKQLMGQSVGVEQCYIVSEETVFNIRGDKFRRVEVRVSGSVEGWASREKGSRAIYFSDGPTSFLPSPVLPVRARMASAGMKPQPVTG
jgi:hypothetical protein